MGIALAFTGVRKGSLQLHIIFAAISPCSALRNGLSHFGSGRVDLIFSGGIIKVKNEEQKQTTSPKRYMKSENKNMNVIAGKDAGAGIIKVTGNDRYYMTDANSCAGTTLHLQIR